MNGGLPCKCILATSKIRRLGVLPSPGKYMKPSSKQPLVLSMLNQPKIKLGQLVGKKLYGIGVQFSPMDPYPEWMICGIFKKSCSQQIYQSMHRCVSQSIILFRLNRSGRVIYFRYTYHPSMVGVHGGEMDPESMQFYSAHFCVTKLRLR